MATFKEAQGLIHVINPIMNEFTLCGDAFDLSSDIEGYEQRATKKRTVTCPHCAEIINDVRGVRIQRGFLTRSED